MFLGLFESVSSNGVLRCSGWMFLLLSLQINMMLANLYRKAGQERSAVTSYKEVLRQCPIALDAIIGTCAPSWKWCRDRLDAV